MVIKSGMVIVIDQIISVYIIIARWQHLTGKLYLFVIIIVNNYYKYSTTSIASDYHPVSQTSINLETQTMSKKNIRPQQVAPIQRQVITTSCQGEKALFASTECDIFTRQCTPFAGDDAE